MTFGTLLREHRKRTCISGTAMCRDLRFSSAYLSKLEKGNSSPPSPYRVEAFCRYLALDGKQSRELHYAAAQAKGYKI